MSPEPLATAPTPRPIRLEINNAGGWKLIARFDASNEELADKACAAGQLLGEINPGSTFRLATDEPLPHVLMRWCAARGWWIVASDQQWAR